MNKPDITRALDFVMEHFDDTDLYEASGIRKEIWDRSRVDSLMRYYKKSYKYHIGKPTNTVVVLKNVIAKCMRDMFCNPEWIVEKLKQTYDNTPDAEVEEYSRMSLSAMLDEGCVEKNVTEHKKIEFMIPMLVHLERLLEACDDL